MENKDQKPLNDQTNEKKSVSTTDNQETNLEKNVNNDTPNQENQEKQTTPDEKKQQVKENKNSKHSDESGKHEKESIRKNQDETGKQEPEKEKSIADKILQQLAEKKRKPLKFSDFKPAKDKVELLKTEEEKNKQQEKQDEDFSDEYDDEEKFEEQADFTEDQEYENEEEKQNEEDLSNLSKAELIEKLKALLEVEDILSIKDSVENVKNTFYKKHHAFLTEKKQKFQDEQQKLPEEEKQEYKQEADKDEEEFKELYNSYKDKKNEYNEKIEQEKTDNLKAKHQVIEEIKNLVNSEESMHETFKEFRELQNRWHNIGNVPQKELKNLWETYHHHVENFYNYVKINKELRDLDLKKNMETKVKLCEKAEELLLEPDVVKAFHILQEYHNQWRETGPAPRENKEELWERFKQATTKINKAHQQFFENKKQEEKNNLKAKTLLCERVEELAEMEINSFKEWNSKSEEVKELQKIWRMIGFAPKKYNQSIYNRFRTACDNFFDQKREFFKKRKQEQAKNLQLKTELCIQAEAWQESTDWKKTTDNYIEIQKKWKTIGPVARKHSDAIWKRFRKACNTFFERKKEFFSQREEREKENLKKKLELIEQVKNFEPSENLQENLNKLKEFQNKWTEIGFVPFKDKDKVQDDFRSAINSVYESLDLDEFKRSELKFKQKIKSIQKSGHTRGKLKAEKEKILNKLQKVENDITLWENNIGFFSRSKNAESMIKEVEKKIVNAKKLAKSLKEKLDMLENSQA